MYSSWRRGDRALQQQQITATAAATAMAPPPSARLRTLLQHVSGGSGAAGCPLPALRPAAATTEAAPQDDDGPVITAENWRSWEEDGYMIIRNIVPPENCDAVQRDMLELLGWDLDDPSTWYTYPGGAMRGGRGSDDPSGAGGGTMLNMWQTQSQWDNRQHPRIYKAFCEIWGTDKLWTSIDTADCKPPARDDLPGWGAAGGIHCDVEQRMLRGGLAMESPGPEATNAPWGLRVQGNLYIDDTGEDGGGFRCGERCEPTRARAHTRPQAHKPPHITSRRGTRQLRPAPEVPASSSGCSADVAFRHACCRACVLSALV
jgi:hypothetical protein